MKSSEKLTLTENTQVNHNEYLYYIDFEEIYQYYNKDNPDEKRSGIELTDSEKESYIFDQTSSQTKFNEKIEQLQTEFIKKYKSFEKADEYRGRKKQHIILTSNLFEIAIEHNNWSFAVELLRKKTKNNLQDNLFIVFKNGLKSVLESTFKTVYIRTGSWSVEPLKIPNEL